MNKVMPLNQDNKIQAEDSSYQIRIPVQRVQDQLNQQQHKQKIKQKEKVKEKMLSNSKKQIKFHVDIQHSSSINQSKPEQIDKKQEKKEIHMPIQQKLCKICLEQGFYSDQLSSNGALNSKLIITPCLCTGSIGFVHMQCMKHWIQRQIKKKHEKKIDCQICHKRIHYQMRSKLQFVCSLQNFIDKLRVFHIMSTIFLVISLIVLIVILQLPQQIVTLNQSLRTIFLVIIALIVFGIIVVIILMIRQCFFNKKKQIQYIYSFQEWQSVISRSFRTIRGESGRTIRSQSNFASRRTFSRNDQSRSNDSRNRTQQDRDRDRQRQREREIHREQSIENQNLNQRRNPSIDNIQNQQ